MNTMNTYRKLTAAEITALEKQHCRCADWNAVEAAQDFSPLHICNVNFSGQVKLGAFTKTITLPGGLQRNAGISNANIHHCDIRNNVYISNIGSSIANYTIDEDSVIENVGTLVAEGKCNFGNGVRVKAVNEMGWREVPIYNELSAQAACIIALYRHRPKVLKQLFKLIDEYAEGQSSTMGYVGKNVHISGCNLIKNVKIGESAILEGALRLTDGAINSCPEAPAYIGQGVIASHFIVAEGSKITDNAIVDRCFVGQGVHLGKMYSAENSLFFANSECFNGEACSIFAGPYTVSHHKSTLLIAGVYSFFNAGSGTNQSNHMYKLGPIHQGLLERGCKTGSDAYLMFPARVGAFSAVMGRHKGHLDTSSLPFSYVVEKNGATHVVPGMNLRSVGVWRDVQKWPERDRRKAVKRLDLVNFELLTPYSVGVILRGIAELEQLQAQASEANILTYKGAKVSCGALFKGLQLYNDAVNIFICNELEKRLAKAKWSNTAELQAALRPEDEAGKGLWHDLAGMIVPQTELTRLLDDIENGTLATLNDISERFEAMHRSCHSWAWTWTTDLLRARCQKSVEQLTAQDVAHLVAAGVKAEEEVNRALKVEVDREVELLDRIPLDFDAHAHPTDSIPFAAQLTRWVEAQQARRAALLKQLEAAGQ